MDFGDFDRERMFRAVWESVRIERPIPYSLFTFGQSELPYYLVVGADGDGDTVSITKGEVRISRPLIVRPGDDRPEFRNFFEDPQYEGLVDFLMARSAGFEQLRFENESGRAEIVTDTVDEAVDRLNARLDSEEEDRVGILSAPPGLGGVALFKFAAERVVSSAPDNIQELRERGFLP